MFFIPCAVSGAATLVLTFTAAVPPSRCCIPALENCTDPSHLQFAPPWLLNHSRQFYPPVVSFFPISRLDWAREEIHAIAAGG